MVFRLIDGVLQKKYATAQQVEKDRPYTKAREAFAAALYAAKKIKENE